ncbi:MAG: putative peptide chain release factor RF1 [Candidatus Hodgkinia cicadicola]|nr:MAG: putative peptide chain release factor RF1 [Candidatus Hodgkinia cicadicola]
MAKRKAHNLQNRVRVPVALAQAAKTVIELKPGVGGAEASLFAEQLLRMYVKFAIKMGWSCDVMCANSAEAGGIKEASLLIAGKDAALWLAHEPGVHRVQRVPQTEAKSRVHTSAVKVAVLAAADDVDQIQLLPSELKIETMRASGAGGQHVNTTDSAVRITHLPSGVTACSSKKSQHQNRAKAMALLKYRLITLTKFNMLCSQRELRKAQVGSGSRTEKMRTYNFAQDRVTDHKLKVSSSGVDRILNGELKSFVSKLIAQTGSN